MNAIDLLKKDHEVVADLFEQVRNTPESKHSALFTKIKAELDTHAHIEETVFYPTLKKQGNKKLVDITSEGIEEHHQIKIFLTETNGQRRQKDVFEAKLKVLMEDVEHHVDEEEDEMFPLVEDQFSDEALERLGMALSSEKRKFVGKNPTIAKNLVKRPAEKKSTLGNIYDKAVTAVEGIFTGKSDGRRSAKPAAKGTGNGRTSTSRKAAGNGNGQAGKKTKSAKARKTASGSKPRAARSSKAAAPKRRSSSARKGAAAK